MHLNGFSFKCSQYTAVKKLKYAIGSVLVAAHYTKFGYQNQYWEGRNGIRTFPQAISSSIFVFLVSL